MTRTDLEKRTWFLKGLLPGLFKGLLPGLLHPSSAGIGESNPVKPDRPCCRTSLLIKSKKIFFNIHTYTYVCIKKTRKCLAKIYFDKIFRAYRVFIKYCFFSKILIYIPDSVFSRCQCVYTQQAGRTPALQQNRQS